MKENSVVVSLFQNGVSRCGIFLKIANRNSDMNFKMFNITLIQYHVRIHYLRLYIMKPIEGTNLQITINEYKPRLQLPTVAGQ